MYRPEQLKNIKRPSEKAASYKLPPALAGGDREKIGPALAELI
jgi:hypothetical protein